MNILEKISDNDKFSQSLNNNIYVRRCNNDCGKNIYWNKACNFFVEVDTGDRHICPNWKGSENKSPNIDFKKQNSHNSQIVELLTKILYEIERIEEKLHADNKGDSA